MDRKVVAGVMLTVILAGLLLLPSGSAVKESSAHQETSDISPGFFESSAPPVVQWNKAYGGANDDHGYSVVQTSDGGYVITGSTRSYGAGGSDLWLVKTDSAGNHVWNKTYGGTNDDFAWSVVETVDGGYAIAGYTSSYGAGGSDLWLVKTDSAGNQLWTKTYGGTSNEWGHSVVQTSDGGYALAGRTWSYGGTNGAMYLVKTDSAGELSWYKVYIRSSDFDGAWSMVQTSDGGYALAGQTVGALSDMWLVKTDSAGNKLWDRTYGVTGHDVAFSVVQTGDGGYALGGYTSSTIRNFLLVKTDSDGNSEWSRTYGGANDDHGYSVVQTSDGGYAMSGFTRSYGAGGSDLWLVKTDSAGTMQWDKTYGGTNDDEARSLVLTDDEGYALAGSTESHGAGGSDFWLIKLAGSQSEGYILRVQSGNNFVGLPISYSGDYGGTKVTNNFAFFDIGPYDSPFTVTLTAPQTHRARELEYQFDHWELNGEDKGLSPSLLVAVDDTSTIRMASAWYVEKQYPYLDPAEFTPHVWIAEAESQTLQAYPIVYYYGPVGDSPGNPSKWIFEYWFYFPEDIALWKDWHDLGGIVPMPEPTPHDWEPVYVTVDASGQVLDFESTVHYGWHKTTWYDGGVTINQETGRPYPVLVDQTHPKVVFLQYTHTPWLPYDDPSANENLEEKGHGYSITRLSLDPSDDPLYKAGLDPDYRADIIDPFAKGDDLEHVGDKTAWWTESYAAYMTLRIGAPKLLHLPFYVSPIIGFLADVPAVGGNPSTKVYIGDSPTSLSWLVTQGAYYTGEEIYYGITLTPGTELLDHLDFYIDYSGQNCFSYEEIFHMEIRPSGETYFMSSPTYGFYPAEPLVFIQPGEYRLRVEGLAWPNNGGRLLHIRQGSVVAVTSGVQVTLQESQQHLYLHAYDAEGHHVGLNYQTNSSESGISEACYSYFGNETLLILPPNVTDFKVVVDALYAEEQIETYNLTVMTINMGQISDIVVIQASIEKGTSKEYKVQASDALNITISEIEPPWFVKYQLWIICGIIAAVAILAVMVALLRRRQRLRA